MSAHQRHLSVVTNPKPDLDAQMREVIRLRDLVRRAKLSPEDRDEISAEEKPAG
jgi:hypothetical protein